jgi:hypothetical protein
VLAVPSYAVGLCCRCCWTGRALHTTHVCVSVRRPSRPPTAVQWPVPPWFLQPEASLSGHMLHRTDLRRSELAVATAVVVTSAVQPNQNSIRSEI